MTTEATSTEAPVETPPPAVEPPQYGLDAVRRVIEGKGKPTPAAEPEDDEDDEDAPPAPNATKPKKTIGQKIRGLRQDRAQLRAELAELKAKVTTPAPEPGAGLDLELAKRDPLAALVKAGLPQEEALDLIQKSVLQKGQLPPAVASVVDELRGQIEAAVKRAEEAEQKRADLEARIAEKEERAAHEAGEYALRIEAKDTAKYPELEGYFWEELEAPIFSAIQYLVDQKKAKGEPPLAQPGEVLGMVNAAFRAHHEKILKRKPGAAATPAPAAPPAPAKGKPALAPVTPSKTSGGKVRMPTDQEIRERIARASAGR